MARPERVTLLKKIEELRESRVLAFITGDRQGALAQIGDDAIRPLYNHLRTMKHCPKLDLLIYSRGGAIDVPWRIVTALRTTADEWSILVPFRANSAATLIALGADKIVLGRQGELGPIDPIMAIQKSVQVPGGGVVQIQDSINVEDVMAFITFVGERAGLSDQDALTTCLGKLTERLDAVSLGSAYRTHLHIRDVAHRILVSRKTPAPEHILKTVIETLADKMYAHGHAIGLTEAQSIGLPVEAAPPDLDTAMWELLNDYEVDMKLLDPIDPFVATASSDTHSEPAKLAIIESTWGISSYEAEVRVQAKRQIPANLGLNLSLTLQFPPQSGVASPNPQAMQQLLQQMQAQLAPLAQQAVQEAIRRQAPLIGFDMRYVGAKWITRT